MKINLSQHKGLVVFAILFVAALAPAFGTTLPGDSFGWITTVKGWLIGPVGAALGTIGVIGAGAMVALTQGKGIGVLFWVLVGLGIVFGAPNLLNLFFPNAGASGFLLH